MSSTKPALACFPYGLDLRTLRATRPALAPAAGSRIAFDIAEHARLSDREQQTLLAERYVISAALSHGAPADARREYLASFEANVDLVLKKESITMSKLAMLSRGFEPLVQAKEAEYEEIRSGDV